jgi:putative flippase GtrA
MAVFDPRQPSEWKALFRYYQAGIVNTVFGFGAFSALVWMGLGIFVAQIVAHVMGVAFNYVTYSRYAFAGHQASTWRFVISYAANYLLSLAALWLFSRVVASPYFAGGLTVGTVSIINFFILKRLVFAPPKSACEI